MLGGLWARGVDNRWCEEELYPPPPLPPSRQHWGGATRPVENNKRFHTPVIVCNHVQLILLLLTDFWFGFKWWSLNLVQMNALFFFSVLLSFRTINRWYTGKKEKNTEQIHPSHSDLNCTWVYLERIISAIQCYFIKLYWTDQFVRRSLFHINTELIQGRQIVPNLLLYSALSLYFCFIFWWK